MKIFGNTEVSKGIISSIIASLLFYILLEPILHFTWNGLANLSKVSYFSFRDHLYFNAALGQRNHLAFAILCFLLIILIGTFAIILSSIFIKMKQSKEKFNMVLAKNDSENLSPDQKEAYNKKQNEERVDTIKKLEKHFKGIIYYKIIACVLMILLSISMFILIFDSYTDLQLNTSFNQRLNAIGPYIDIQTEKLLKAEWATMKNRDDFEKINFKIQNIATTNKVEIPENLLK